MNTSEGVVRKCFQFGRFRLDPVARTFHRGDTPVALSPKAFDTLVALVEHAGEILDKKILMDLVWGDTAVEENNLAQAIAAIRKALGEQAGERRCIVTVPGRGYSFAAEVSETPPIALKGSSKLVFRRVLPVVSGAVVAGALLLALFRPAIEEPRRMPLTGAGDEGGTVSFSPDGGRVAYLWRAGEGKNGIYVKVIGAGDPMPLVIGNDARDPAWAPDGRHIAYYREPGGLYMIPATGGADQLITPTSDSGYGGRRMSWSPDGKYIAFAEIEAETRFRSIFAVSIETRERRRLTTGVSNFGDRSPAFSPDGKHLAFVRQWNSGAVAVCLEPSAGGEPRRITELDDKASGFDWTPDGREIVYTSMRGGFAVLSRMPASGGAPRPVSAAGYGVSLAAIARSGNRLAYTHAESTINMWRSELDRPGSPRKIAPSVRRTSSPQFSPDGKKLVFSSNRSGPIEIWTSDSEGAQLLRMTNWGEKGVHVGTPRWSPDGREIAFDARPGSNPDIFVIPASGGAPRSITSDAAEDVLPSYSRDGRWIYFTSDRSGVSQIWKVTRSGQGAVQITANGGFAGLESTDGRYLYYLKDKPSIALWRTPTAGGGEEKVFDGAAVWKHNPLRRIWGLWTVAPGGILFIDHESPERQSRRWQLKRLDTETGSARTLSVIPGQPALQVPSLAASLDGKIVIYTQVETRPNMIMLLENFH